jgi:DNA-binding NtrC family response regulator
MVRQRPRALGRADALGIKSDPSKRLDRIDALKSLAQTLLSEIEYLTEQDALSEVTGLNLQAQVRRFEAQLIRMALVRTGGRQKEAALLLGSKVTTLNTKIKRYGIRIPRDYSQPAKPVPQTSRT